VHSSSLGLGYRFAGTNVRCVVQESEPLNLSPLFWGQLEPHFVKVARNVFLLILNFEQQVGKLG